MPVIRTETKAAPLQYKLRPRKSKSLAVPSSSDSEGREEGTASPSASDPEVQESKASSDDDEDSAVKPVRPSRLDPIMAGAARHGSVREAGAPEFSKIYYQVHVYDQEGKQQDVSFQASLSRGFFRARGDWTCYRRNYITVSVQLVDLPQPLLLYNGQTLEHFGFKLSGCTCRDPPEPIDLIQHTAKRDKGPQDQPEFRPIEAAEFQTLWDRIQFRTATANNGKKQEQQQYFSLRVSLMAYATGNNLPGAWVEIAARYSDPLVVRGRSPGHYNDPHDRPASSVSPEQPQARVVRPTRAKRPHQPIAPRPPQPAPTYAGPIMMDAVPALRQAIRRGEPYPVPRHVHLVYAGNMRLPAEQYVSSRTPQDHGRPVHQTMTLPLPPPPPMQLQLPPLRLEGSGSNEGSRLPTYDEVIQGSKSPRSGTEHSTPVSLVSLPHGQETADAPLLGDLPPSPPADHKAAGLSESRCTTDTGHPLLAGHTKLNDGRVRIDQLLAGKQSPAPATMDTKKKDNGKPSST